jgi:hypothetical protein
MLQLLKHQNCKHVRDRLTFHHLTGGARREPRSFMYEQENRVMRCVLRRREVSFVSPIMDGLVGGAGSWKQERSLFPMSLFEVPAVAS